MRFWSGTLSPDSRFLPRVAFVLTLVQAAWFCRYGIDPHHDGVILKPALDVVSGMALFRDTFSQYGPVSTWILAIPVGIFGASFLVIKLTAALFYALTASLLARTWAKFLSPRLTAFCLMLWLLHAPYLASDRVFQAWPSVFALFFQCGALLLLLAALGAESTRMEEGRRPLPGSRAPVLLFGSGALGGLCLATRQPVGALFLLGVGGVLLLRALMNRAWRRAWVDLAVFVGGALGVLVSLGAVLKIQGALEPWYQQNVLWPSEWAKAWFGTGPERIFHFLIRHKVEVRVLTPVLLLAGWALPWLRSRWGGRAAAWGGAFLGAALFFRVPLPTYSGGALTLVPGMSVFFTPWLLWRGRHRGWRVPGPWIELSIAAVVLASWTQFYPVNDSRHVYWAITPAIGFFVWQLHQWLGSDERATRNGILVWLLSVALSQGQAAWHKLSQSTESIDDPVLRGLRIESAQARALRPVVGKLRELTASGRPILVEGMDLFYSLFTSNPSHPDPMAMIWPLGSLKRSHFDARGVEFARRERPVLVYQSERLEPAPVWPPLPEYQKEYEGTDPWYGAQKPISLWAWR